MNIREIAQFTQNYCEINREERNYAAILFAALCKPGNAQRFLKQCGIEEKPGPDFGIYFEYAYLRDLWSRIEDDGVKREIIRQHLRINGIDEIINLPIVEINRKFGVGGQPSDKFVQYPGKWAIVKYNNSFQNNEDFLKVCRFKWSFNIKPDIVIHLDKNHAICIEAKYESGEGWYPASEIEKTIFKNREIPSYVKQTDLQKYMMEELLGLEMAFKFIVYKKESSETHKVMSWAEVFESLDMSEMPPFAIEMVKNLRREAAITSRPT
jgi:hypothetical protein